MPKRNTIFSTGYYYHIYNRAVADNLLFLNGDNYLFFLERIRLFLLPIGEIMAYCLMPNHYHILMKLNLTSLSEAMHKLALSYSVSFNNYYSRSGHLFQGRFRAKHVTDTQYLVHLSRYIHLNPKAANLVKKAEEWKYSSLMEYYGIRSNKLVNIGIILDIFADNEKMDLENMRKRYRKFVESWDPEYMDFRYRK